MSKYYVSGYTPPDDAKSSDDVKRYQKMLGVTVDGIWGKNTQAAYDNYTKSKSGSSSGSNTGTSAQDAYLADIMSYIETALRPAVDKAIENRRSAGDEQMAEFDADAAARGMESSTYVSSMKAREANDIEDDINDIETSYQSTLANELYEALQDYNEMELTREQNDRQYELELMRLEQEQFNAQYPSSDEASSSSRYDVVGLYEYSDYVDYLGALSSSSRHKFFYSDEMYWTELRNGVIDDIGKEGYFALLDRFTNASVVDDSHGSSSRNSNRNNNTTS